MLRVLKVIPAAFMLLLGGSSCTLADSGPYFPFGHPTGAGLTSATKKDAAGNPQLYGGSSGAPDNWSMSQWNTPSDFPPLTYQQSTNSWTTGNGMSAFQWYPPASPNDAATIAIAQNGQFLPCQNGEFDMGFGPNGWAAADNPSQYPAVAIKDTPHLDLMTHLYMSGTYTLNGVRSGGNSSYHCDVNQATSAVSVALLNKSVTPYQFFFYNLHFTGFCVQSGTANDQYAACQQAVNKQQPSWFWTGTSAPSPHYDVPANQGGHPQWGMDDSLNSYSPSGPGNILDNNPHGLAIDLLPRLQQIITTNPYNMDPNFSHWEVTATGFGQADWGNVYLASTFKDFVLLYSCRDNVQGCPGQN